ncbi:MAG: EAL domain-containing protein [Campylobacterales bacterium]|nr:EAL domain-containing protein [Campylobacterales bacterium]
MILKNFIQPKNDSVECGQRVEEIIALMNARGVNHMVMLQEKKPYGIITERDILRLLHQKNTMKSLACSLCSRQLIKANGNRSLEYALGLMVDQKLRRIVVVNDGGEYLGTVSQEEIIYQFEADIFKASTKLYDFLHIATEAITLEPEQTLGAAIEVMARQNIGSVLVGKKGEPQGIVTESDVLHLAQTSEMFSMALKDVMHTPLTFFESSVEIEHVLEVIKEQHIRRIAIFDKSQSTYFVMTTRDILRNLQGSYSNFLEKKLQSNRLMYNQMNELMIEVLDLGEVYVIGWANERAKHELDVQIDDDVSVFLPKTLWEETLRVFDQGNRHVEEYITLNQKTYRFSASCSVILGTKVIKLLLSDISAIHRLNLELTEQVDSIKDSLEERQSLYEETFNQHAIGIGYISQEGVILEVNPYIASLLGYTQEELVGKNVADVSHSEDVPLGDLVRARLVSETDHTEEKFEKRYRKKDGTYIWVEVALSVQRTKTGEVKHIVGFVQDISERYEAARALMAQKNLLSTVINSVEDFIFYKNTQCEYIGGNQPWLDFIGQDVQEILGKTSEAFYPEEISAQCALTDAKVFQTRQHMTFMESVFKEDGTVHVLEVRKSPLINENNEVIGLVGVAHDMTQKRQQEQQQLLAQSVFENTAEGIIVTDKHQIITSVNPAFTEITGYEAEEVIGRPPTLLSSGVHKKSFYQAMWKRILSRGYWQGEVWNVRKNGENFPELLTISEVKDTQGEVVHYIGVFSDITLMKQTQQQLEFMAHHDPLTKLPNRLLLEARLEHAIEWARRDQFNIAVLFIDLDQFKEINDTFGHSVGDLILQEVAVRFRSLLREKDTIARIGGDEFVIVLEEYEDLLYLEQVVKRILDLFKDAFLVKERNFNLTCSIGISLYPNDGKDIETLIKNADAAMYKAKESGRNTYTFYTTEITHTLFEKMLMENELRRAIDAQEFTLFYQPQIDMRTGKMVGVEALARWEHAGMGIIMPDKFIPLSEGTKLIIPIGRQLLEIACLQTKVWVDRGLCGPAWKTAVNISAVQITHDDLYEAIDEVTKKTGLAPHYLELELTETYIMQNPKVARVLMDKLKKLGVTLAVDDFGIGYSSLSYLKQFPLDRLKVDRSFIRDIPDDSDDMAITKAILALGKSLGLEVLAEGVEDAVQKEFLLEEGCFLAQGYFYSPPLPWAELEKAHERFSW